MRTLLAYPEVRLSVALIHVAGHVVVLAHKGKTTLEFQSSAEENLASVCIAP